MEKGHRRGFTLVEVMIVMLLFSKLLLMIFPMRRMAVWVLDHARTQEQAEMLGDAAWRYVADRLETGAVEVEELDGLSMDAFHIDTLKPEIEVEESRSGRVLVTVRVMDGKKDLYERNGSVPGVSLLAFEVYAFYIKSVARSFYSQLLLLWIPMRTKFPLCFLSAFFLMLFLIPFI